MEFKNQAEGRPGNSSYGGGSETETLEWESLKDAQTHRKHIETNRVFEFLAGLNSEYDIVRQQILTRDSVALSQAYFLVHSEETRRKVMMQPQPLTPALVAVKPKTGGDSERDRKKEDKRDVVCEHCKKPKHTKETCWKLHPHLVPTKLRNKKGNAHAAVTTDSASLSGTRGTPLETLAAVRAALI
ncbi:PREDICTED: uncharacterized protein LOC104587658 [Nelumbo nucifera]|uniref:Uncharacterized protein LOC104587658 n=1 Tax=Nelumbo nucifera TaxID=4432 RepID=A0A1U7YW90_NELNU|nr:PREDICTED: uncharacterized protein LOC104587658 [Nelumbo nucifera]